MFQLLLPFSSIAYKLYTSPSWLSSLASVPPSNLHSLLYQALSLLPLSCMYVYHFYCLQSVLMSLHQCPCLTDVQHGRYNHIALFTLIFVALFNSLLSNTSFLILLSLWQSYPQCIHIFTPHLWSNYMYHHNLLKLFSVSSFLSDSNITLSVSSAIFTWVVDICTPPGKTVLRNLIHLKFNYILLIRHCQHKLVL